MNDLNYAHSGYAYQDLVAAVMAVDLILGNAEVITCDVQLSGPADKFDDLTIEWADGRRDRRQIKYQEQPRALSVDTFVRTPRKLKLDDVFRGILADRAAFPDALTQTSYTLYVRDSDAVDPVLTQVLKAADPDPGPTIGGTATTRYRFDAAALWRGVHREAAGRRPAGDAYEFLREVPDSTDGPEPLSMECIAMCCESFAVEVNAPAMSNSFTEPGPLEELLLRRLRSEVGAGGYPNEDRTAVDVAITLVAEAARARNMQQPLTRRDVLTALRLRTDYGTVRRRSPVKADEQVARPTAVDAVVAGVKAVGADGGFVVVEGAPGQGKSWLADQVRAALSFGDWTVAEHFCFLNDSEEEREDRVASERIFGSLMERVASAHPGLASVQRPILSADEQSLMRLVGSVVEQSGPVALIVDGLDHVTRVRVAAPGSASPASVLTAQLAALSPPPGCVVIVLSQPGDHLEPLVAAGAVCVSTPAMGRVDIEGLLERHQVIGPRPAELDGGGQDGAGQNGDDQGAASDVNEVPEHLRGEDREALVDAVLARSRGNPLYATYLSRELLRGDGAVPGSAIELLESVPAYDGSLEGYYEHLSKLLEPGGQAVADTLTVVEFPLTSEELKAIQPGEQHRVDAALRVLAPVLTMAPGGGVRIYHESFARYLRRVLEEYPGAFEARVDAVTAWLEKQGFYCDVRAFGSLITLLARSRRDADVVALVDRDYAVSAVAAGFAPSVIRSNLVAAVRSAHLIGDWPAVVRCVELTRAVSTYEEERLPEVDPLFVDVRVAMLGADAVVERMLVDGSVAMPPEAGLLLCAELDRAGVAPPWREYLSAWRDARRAGDRQPDVETTLAMLRGHVRLITAAAGHETDKGETGGETGPVSGSETVDADSDVPEPRAESGVDVGADLGAAAPGEEDPADPLKQVLAFAQAWADQGRAFERYRALVEVLADTAEPDTVARFVERLEHGGTARLALATVLSELVPGQRVDPFGTAQDWAAAALESGVPSGHAHRLAALGALDGLLADESSDGVDDALPVTRAVLQDSGFRHAGRFLDVLVAYRHRPLVLDAVLSELTGEGWYRCWLRFCVELNRAEGAVASGCEVAEASRMAATALQRLTVDVRPFAGEPRAVDLSPAMDRIFSTLDRALRLLEPEQWRAGVELLVGVSDGITRSLSGGMGVPLPTERLMDVAMQTAPSAQLSFIRELVRIEIAAGAHMLYSDVATLHLTAARCALWQAEALDGVAAVTGAEDAVPSTERQALLDEASHEWTQACRCLLGYGWRKDITVFEVLDPMPSLVGLERAMGLERLANAQDLAYRAWRHTDGKETNHAPVQWWKELASVDPVSHAELSSARALSAQGSPSPFEEMRADLLTSHHDRADPLLAALLSATVNDAPVSGVYADIVSRYVATTSAVDEAVLQRLVTRGDEMVAAAATSGSDERPVRARQRAEQAVVNECAAARGLRTIGSEQETDEAVAAASGGEPGYAASMNEQDEKELAEATVVARQVAEQAPAGLAGATVLIRSWRRSPTSRGRAEARTGLIEVYADALVTRFEQMMDAGHSSEIRTALAALADVTDLSESHRLLARIGELLLSAGGTAGDGGEPEDVRTVGAATAYALAWTQARGDRGWVSFGGHSYMSMLATATQLSPAVAAEAVALGVGRRLSSQSYRSMGITKALIEAFAAGALMPGRDGPAGAVAFETWDEASRIIGDRLVSTGGDGAPVRYAGVAGVSPLGAVGGDAQATLEAQQPTSADVDYAFAVAIVAGLSHPGRENLRRTLLALGDLARLRPELFSQVVPLGLRAAEGALVPTWLLMVIEDASAATPDVARHAIVELTELTGSEFLIVRALARRILAQVSGTHEDPPLAASDLTMFPAVLESEVTSERAAKAVDATRSVRARVAGVDAQVPGFAEAVVELSARRTETPDFVEAMGEAYRELSRDKGWPDAVLPLEHEIEAAVQTAAGAVRAKLASQGLIDPAPVENEERLADFLLPSALPLIVERGRVPRPAIGVTPDGDDPMWVLAEQVLSGGAAGELVTEDSAPSGSEVMHAVARHEGVLSVCLDEGPWLPIASEDADPYAGWFWLAINEVRKTPHGYGSKSDVLTRTQTGLEVDLPVAAADMESHERSPLGLAPITQWSIARGGEPVDPAPQRGPLGAVARPTNRFKDDVYFQGLPEALLSPAPLLVTALGLSAVAPDADELVMTDSDGAALAHVTWRSQYVHSEHFLVYPTIVGSGLLLRPDLVAKLVSQWGEKLTWRSWAARHDAEDEG